MFPMFSDVLRCSAIPAFGFHRLRIASIVKARHDIA